MLRGWVLLLVCANLAFWAYAQGYLAGIGLAPYNPREPQRLLQQVSPDAIRLVTAAPAAAPVADPLTATEPVTVSEPPPEPTTDVAQSVDEAPALSQPVNVAPVVTAPPPLTTPTLPNTCWLATGLPAAQEVLVRAALRNMEDMQDRWALESGLLPARWIVYLGPLANDTVLQQRRADFRRRGIDHREVSTPGLTPGLALGTYSTQEAAQRATDALQQGGVSGLRVLQERPDTPVYALRLQGITDAQRRRIESTGILRDRPLQRCP